MNAELQRIARRDKKAFLSDQCKELEENNRMRKTRDLFKKIRWRPDFPGAPRMGKPWSRERDRNRVGKLDCSLGDVIQGRLWPPQNLSLQRSRYLPVTLQPPSMVRGATDSETHSFDKSLLSTYCVPCREGLGRQQHLRGHPCATTPCPP